MQGSCPSMATLSSLVILDTSIFVDYLRYGRHEDRIDSLTGVVRTSSVVLAELWRGASRPSELAYLRTLEKNHSILVPTKQNWLESGELLGQVRVDRGFTPEKLRNLHFDVLIALTARSHGARLITSDRADFELIVSYKAAKDLNLEIW
jgi:predicted nucleic acid-binding protein